MGAGYLAFIRIVESAIMRKRLITICALLTVLTDTMAQNGKTVSEEKMREVYEEIKTPYKYGLVMVPADSTQKMDCPTVFRKGRRWYMTYLVFTGRGYETWLATSRDLLNWKPKGRLLSFSDTTEWDTHQKAGYPGLQDPEWGGSYRLKKQHGRYWMSYFGGNERGYESGLLSIGIAYTRKNPAKVHEWTRVGTPVLGSRDADVRWWENKKQFKSSIVYDEQRQTGYPYVMFYNANGDTALNNIRTRWYERIGMAVSDDMINWKRFGEEPVMHHPQGITGDAVLQKWGDLWVMFYFGAFWEGRKDAFNRFACSYDLVNWTDWSGADLINSTEDYDRRFAHKSFVVKHKNVVYHFYCAVDNKDNRGIAVATSVPKGQSKLHFASRK
mgnify:CR=1 FL=1